MWRGRMKVAVPCSARTRNAARRKTPACRMLLCGRVAVAIGRIGLTESEHSYLDERDAGTVRVPAQACGWPNHPERMRGAGITGLVLCLRSTFLLIGAVQVPPAGDQ